MPALPCKGLGKLTQGTKTLLSSPSRPEGPPFPSWAPESQALSTSDGFTPPPTLPGRIKLVPSALKSWFISASPGVLGQCCTCPMRLAPHKHLGLGDACTSSPFTAGSVATAPVTPVSLWSVHAGDRWQSPSHAFLYPALRLVQCLLARASRSGLLLGHGDRVAHKALRGSLALGRGWGFERMKGQVRGTPWAFKATSLG